VAFLLIVVVGESRGLGMVRWLLMGCMGVANCAAAWGQTAVGSADDACAPPLPVPAAIARMDKLLIEPGKLDRAALSASIAQDAEAMAYGQAQKVHAAQDWANLCRYRADNARAVAASTRPEVVFLGDSITENWAKADPQLFSSGRMLGRGISGQTSAQMLLRFHADVVALKPKRVHILAGTNDVAGNTGPVGVREYRDNITAMVEMARANGIGVILGSIPPAQRFFWRPELAVAPRIAEFNAWLQAYAKQQRLGFVDYHAALADVAGEDLAPELGNDGVHPNRNGYAVMRRVVLRALQDLR
jgi:lysophospholipase L1-like esterase